MRAYVAIPYGELEIGDSIGVSSRKRLALSPAHAMAEKWLEDVREDEYPERPSRIDGIFLCPSLESCDIWTRLYEQKYGVAPEMYEVEFEGNWFLADGSEYSSIVSSITPETLYNYGAEDLKNMLRYNLNQYWKGMRSQDFDQEFHYSQLPEIVLDGRAVVVGLA
jgi:hypothetical protein